MKSVLAGLQRIGRALMLPIAVLPIAALLLRLGQGDLLDVPAMAAAGQAIFDNLGLLFAIGVAVGLARENSPAPRALQPSLDSSSQRAVQRF
jgi:Phosphotransferase system IIC components, glucose/maltose/N-acetylglucosamine-specific